MLSHGRKQKTPGPPALCGGFASLYSLLAISECCSALFICNTLPAHPVGWFRLSVHPFRFTDAFDVHCLYAVCTSARLLLASLESCEGPLYSGVGMVGCFYMQLPSFDL